MRILAIATILILVGCSRPAQIVYTPFHAFSNSVQGKSFIIVSSKAQEGSLEFKSYAQAISKELIKKGLIEKSVLDAEYVLFMNYSIDNGKQVPFDLPVFGQTGSSGSYTTGQVSSTGSFSATTINTPTYGEVGSIRGSQSVYTRVLKIEMVVKSDYLNNKINNVYECKAISSGSSNQLSEIVPVMIRAIFQDFPGQSGKAKSVMLSIDASEATQKVTSEPTEQ